MSARRHRAASIAKTRAATQTEVPRARHARRVLVLAVLCATTLAAYWPLLSSEFVNFDDPEYVIQNRPVIAGLTWSGVRWAFTAAHAANWHPLTWLSHMTDVSLFGLNPAGHHATNLLLHTITAALVFFVFHARTGSVWRSAWVAVLFAIHPAHVESVAWISERKDVLSGVFWFATIGVYIAWVRRRGGVKYALVLILLAAGLMSKPMVVTLPVVLLLLDYWPLGRFAEEGRTKTSLRVARERVVEKLPLFLLSITSSVVTFLVQRAGGAVGSLDTFPLGVRIGNAVLAYVRYLRVLFWPMDLAVFYPHPGASIRPVSVAAGALLLGALTAAAVALRKKAPFFFVGWCWFVVTLLPVIGLVQVGKQATADRYTYIPYVGLFVAIAWGGASIAARWSWGRTAVRGVAVATALALTIRAAVQARYWKNSESLLLHAIRVTKDNSVAQNNLGNYYNTTARPADALPHLQEALRLRPDDPAVLVNIGHSLFLLNRFDEAAANFSRALELEPSNDVALNNLARVRYLQGDVGEAIRLYRAAVALQPDWIDTRKRLALALLVEGENAAALLELERGVSRFPEDGQARSFRDEVREFIRDPQGSASGPFRRVLAAEHRNLGIALMGRKRNREAAQQLERALTLFPEDFSTRLNRGVLFTEAGRLDEAAAEFGEAVRLNPSSALAHTDLGYVLFLQGRRQEAIDQHREALRLQPDFSLARHNLELAEQDGSELRGAKGQARPPNPDGPLHR